MERAGKSGSGKENVFGGEGEEEGGVHTRGGREGEETEGEDKAVSDT